MAFNQSRVANPLLFCASFKASFDRISEDWTKFIDKMQNTTYNGLFKELLIFQNSDLTKQRDLVDKITEFC